LTLCHVTLPYRLHRGDSCLNDMDKRSGAVEMIPACLQAMTPSLPETEL
jgi:hypothetical protein